MEIKKYTVELEWGEMHDLASALESYIESNLSLKTKPSQDDLFNDFTSELELLNSFLGTGFGYTLNVSKKTPEGHHLFDSKRKEYTLAEEWLEALLKQRRKEYERDKK